MSDRITLATGAFSGALAIALGAFGAHALKSTLVETNSLDTYELASRYQIYHSLLLVLIGVLMERSAKKSKLGIAAYLILFGILMFCGSLYMLALTSFRWVVFVTPLGGLLLIAGWVMLGWSVITPALPSQEKEQGKL